MTNDSTLCLTVDVKRQPAKSPRKSTINFIRQFSKAYVAIAGVATINGVICN